MELIDIFNKGMQNDKMAGNYHSIMQKANIVFFYIIAMILSKKNRFSGGSIAFINGSRGYETILGDLSKTYSIFHGSYFKKIKNFNGKNSLFSNMNFFERLRTTYLGLKHYFNNYSQVESLVYWMEFYLIYNFISKSKTTRIITPGFGDRQTTWISYISFNNSITFEIFQHGIIYNDTIGHKIFCSKIYAFDQFQIQLFKDYKIINKSCEYEIRGFQSVINFELYAKENRIVIGIATQQNSTFINEIIKELLLLKIDFVIIIMIHPSEKSYHYLRYYFSRKVIIERVKKYINLDILITQNSTIILDYIINGFNGEIFRVDPSLANCVLDHMLGIRYIKRIEDIMDVIGGYVKDLRKED